MAARRRYQAQQVLPDEYCELFLRNRLQPEERLMWAVLEDAFAGFQRNCIADDEHGREAFEEVESWFMTEGDCSLYSLETICTSLDIDASCLRKRLLAWKSNVGARGRHTTGTHGVEKLQFLLYSRKKGGL